MDAHRAAVLLIVAGSLGGPALAQETGAAAYAEGDFARAVELWRREAAEGSPRAMLGLGQLNDLGLGIARDAARARDRYGQAARAGLAEAQFNLAVMQDGGIGGQRDARAAAGWYSRAAAQGHRRAQFNLGLLFAAGDGVARNPDLARHWFTRAARALPAAADRVGGLPRVPSEVRALTAPDPLAGGLVATESGPRATMAWSALPGPPGSDFLIEVARLPDDPDSSGEIIAMRRTEASAVSIALPAGEARYAWHVVRISGQTPRYAAASWQAFAEGGAAGKDVGPAGRITLRVGSSDRSAQNLIDELAPGFRSAGYWVRVSETSAPREQTTVRFTYANDAGQAASVAAFLPVLDSDDAKRVADLEAAPGEIVVDLAGGPKRAER